MLHGLSNILSHLETPKPNPAEPTCNELTAPGRTYFFSNGISFKCRNCGTCCTGDPGTVYVSSVEIDDIARFFGITVTETISRYLYPYKDSYSLKENDAGECCFYENGCRVYDARPKQCRTYPFWLNNLRSEEAWIKAASECPGIGRGRVYSEDAILAIVRSTF